MGQAHYSNTYHCIFLIWAWHVLQLATPESGRSTPDGQRQAAGRDVLAKLLCAAPHRSEHTPAGLPLVRWTPSNCPRRRVCVPAQQKPPLLGSAAVQLTTLPYSVTRSPRVQHLRFEATLETQHHDPSLDRICWLLEAFRDTFSSS